jgi:hypothetical protein
LKLFSNVCLSAWISRTCDCLRSLIPFSNDLIPAISFFQNCPKLWCSRSHGPFHQWHISGSWSECHRDTLNCSGNFLHSEADWQDLPNSFLSFYTSFCCSISKAFLSSKSSWNLLASVT